MKRPVGLKEIAKLAYVSVSTASIALRGDPRVAPQTRERVVTIAKGLGYEPDAVARGLVTGRTQLIGFVNEGYIANHEWNALIFSGLADFLHHAEPRHHLVYYQKDPVELLTPESLTRKVVDGLVLSVNRNRAFLELVASHPIPTVMVDPLFDMDCDSVEADDRRGACVATRHLLELGHRQIAYIGAGFKGVERIHRLRWDGFVDEMSAAGLPPNPGGDAIEPGGALVARALDRHNPTALLCFSDETALQMIRELQARGLAVPRDVSVVGFDDLKSSALMSPAMTTVRLPWIEMGNMAGRMILQRIERPTMASRTEVLAEELIVRESTAPPRR